MNEGILRRIATYSQMESKGQVSGGYVNRYGQILIPRWKIKRDGNYTAVIYSPGHNLHGSFAGGVLAKNWPKEKQLLLLPISLYLPSQSLSPSVPLSSLSHLSVSLVSLSAYLSLSLSLSLSLVQ
ncbi:hypothetical protein AAMO2058_001175600 [Amorphochlora amoebiformis]